VRLRFKIQMIWFLPSRIFAVPSRSELHTSE
jgi:hypothetical protein